MRRFLFLPGSHGGREDVDFVVWCLGRIPVLLRGVMVENGSKVGR